MSVDLPKLVANFDAALGRPPFADPPPAALLAALTDLRAGLLTSVASGTLTADGRGSPELKTTLAVLAAAYARGAANPQAPPAAVFEGLLDAVVLAFPLITYTLKDLIPQSLRFAPRCPATPQLLGLTKSYTKEAVLLLMYGEGVTEEAVKAPTRPPPKPKKGAPAPAPWAPPPLAAPPAVMAELAEAYADGSLPADCRPFVFDTFVGHCRFGDAVGSDDVSAARILAALMPTIRATLNPSQLLRALSPRTVAYFVKLAEDRPDMCPSLLADAESLSGLTPRQALLYRAALKRFIGVGGPQQRPLGEFITAAVLCALVTRTTRLLPSDADEVSEWPDDVEGPTTSDAGMSPFSVASPKTPMPRSPEAAGFPVTDALPQLIVSGALGNRNHSLASNAALVRCAEALVVMDRRIGRLSRAVTYDLPSLNDALVRLMDIAMDVATPAMEAGLALSAVMHLVDTVHNYKNASRRRDPDAPVPSTRQAVTVGANMPLCRAVGMGLTLDCGRAAGKQIRMFAAVWLGHMLRTRSLGLPSLLRCGAAPLFIAPKSAKPAAAQQQQQQPQGKGAAKAGSPNKGGGGGGKSGGKGSGKQQQQGSGKGTAPPPAAVVTTGAAHTAASDSISVPPSVALGPPPKDGMRTLLFKLLQASGSGAALDRAAVGAGVRYLVSMVLEQLETLEEDSESDEEEEDKEAKAKAKEAAIGLGRLDPKDRMGLLAALCAVPIVPAAQYIVDTVLDADDADTNPQSDKKALCRVLVKHGIYPSSRLEPEAPTADGVASPTSTAATAATSGDAATGSLAVEEDDIKWMAFLAEVEEARAAANTTAAEAVKKEMAERLAAARRAQSEYSALKERVRQEQAAAAEAREERLAKQQEVVALVQSAMADREREAAEAIERTKARRALALRRVAMLEAERRRRAEESQAALGALTKERRELSVSLREYLIDTLRMDPTRVYPVLAFLRTQIDSLDADEVHEYLVTGSMAVPLDMTVDVDGEGGGDEAAEIVNLDDTALRHRVATRLRTNDGMDFWGGAIDFAPAEDAPPADAVGVKVSAPTTAAGAVAEEPKVVLSYHRRVAPILDAFDYSSYADSGAVPPPLTRGALETVLPRALLDDRGFCGLTDALYACSSRGLLTVAPGGEVELTPLGAAYHAPFANADKSFRKAIEERALAVQRQLLAAKMAAAKASQAAAEKTANAMFADDLH